MEGLALLMLIWMLPMLAIASYSRHQVYDLSHSYDQDMPVWDSGAPPEISLVEHDEGHGLR